jgi:hypothetical protein
VAWLAGEDQPGPLARSPRPGETDDLAVEVQDLAPALSAVVHPARPYEVVRRAELRVRVLGEYALLRRRLSAEIVGERAPVGAALAEVDSERPEVEKEDSSHEERSDRPEARLRCKRCDRKRGEGRKRETGRQVTPRDVVVRMEFSEKIDDDEPPDSPRDEETGAASLPGEDGSRDNEEK